MTEIEEKLVEVLERVYSAVDWRRVAGGKFPWDVFCHRLKVASYQATIPQFLEKLCHGLGLQSVNVDPDTLDFLRERESEAMSLLRKQSVYLALHAIKGVREKRRRKEEQNENSEV
jgi:hypothetical protein